jgi:hypothetical protein
MNFTRMTLVAIAAAASALGQSYVPQDTRQQIQQQQRYEREMNFYRAGQQKAADAYNRCMSGNNAKTPGACDGYKEWEAYYQRMQSGMQQPTQQYAQQPSQRPVAQYPGQGMFPSAGQVARGVVNGVMTGQTQFQTDPNQLPQQPAVDYRNAMGGYANESSMGPQNLPYGGFQNYQQQPRYQVPQRQVNQPRYQQPAQRPQIQPVQQRPVVQRPAQQRPTPTLIYAPYQGYGGNSSSRRY